MADTRQKLIDGTIATLRDMGIAGTSARAIAAAAGVNQSLVFYHFKTVDDLIDVAGRESTAARIAVYRPRFAEVTSLSQLLTLGRELHTMERDEGNVAVLAQVLAGAQQHPALAEAAQHSLQLWIDEIELVLVRVLATSPLGEIVDAASLARGISASFVGIELYEGVDPDGAEQALASMELLGLLVEVVDDLGPVGRRALRTTLRRTTRKAVRAKKS